MQPRERLQIPGVDLDAELGRGASSVVYRGRQGPNRCAVKLPRARGRWALWAQREAVALARVRDPGLPMVLEVGTVGEQPYIVMELVEGETLAERMAKAPMAPAEVILVATTLARTLAAVHDAGLVHRDVKPRNILVENSGRIRLVDFGFAAPLEGVPDDAAGTPRYAAPEQFRMAAALDGRADLYALGRVLIEACGVELRAVSRAASDNNLRAKVESELREAGVAEPLVRVIAGLVEPEPEDRYPDARALRKDLELVRLERRSLGPTGYDRTRRQPGIVLRESELAEVRAAAVAAAAGTGAAVHIEGAPGSGKSALIASLAAQIEAERIARVAEVRCREGDPPLGALARLLDGIAIALRRGGRAEAFAARASKEIGERAAGVAALLSPSFAEVARLRPGPLPPPFGLVEIAAELIIDLARVEPIVVMIDDAQWMDPASREVLARLGFKLRSAPLLVVMATRPTRSDGPTERRGRHDDEATSIHLGPLAESQAASLIASYLGVPVVEAAIAHRVAALADDTPLGVLEVLRALLDIGGIRPQSGAWRLDVDRAERAELPAGTRALIGARLNELPPASRRVLEAAAILGAEFDDRLLGELLALRADELIYGLADAIRAGLVTPGERGAHRFVHDSVRELTLASLEPGRARDLHQRAAQTLSARGELTLHERFALARHFAAGDLRRSPTEAHRAALDAARDAVARFDNETALEFLGLARDAAGHANLELASAYFRDLGEVHLRMGHLDRAARAFRDALVQAENADTRARLHGRIAWVHQVGDDPDAAWSALDNAFREVGVVLPSETMRSGVQTLQRVAIGGIRKALGRAVESDARGREAAELLADLHYQSARLASEYGKPLRLIQSTLQTVEASERLGPSRALARAKAFRGVITCSLGSHGAGIRELEAARALADALGDPETTALCLQLRSLAECYAGELDAALATIDDILQNQGPWFELGEYCLAAGNGEFIEALRGRPDSALARLQPAIDRLRQSRSSPEAIEDYVLHRARADYAGLGRSADRDAFLGPAFARISASPPTRRTLMGMMTWGPRLRALVESADFGSEFDRVVRAFEAEQFTPRTMHPLLVEFYVALAHGRMYRSFREAPALRKNHLPALRKAATDLRACARLDLFKAHAVLAEAHVAWLEGKADAMRAHLAEAERLADAEDCSWVLYGVERLRAHALLANGKRQSALERARLAETVALEHGAAIRARWIREEFGIAPAAAALRSTRSSPSLSSTSSTRHRQLATLLHAVHAPQANLTPDQQAIAVLDELIVDFDAECAYLYFDPSDHGASIRLGRTRRGTPWSNLPEGRSGLVEAVRERGEIWPPPTPDGESTTLLRDVADGHLVVAPLSLYDSTVGAVLIERPLESPPFGPYERQLLGVLMHQIPIALELARVLAEREELELSLRQARKMEAVGQLAGGVAHDFNNMLQAIRAAAEVVRSSAGLDADAVDEIEVISQAADRATSLTRQLLAFSRHRPAPLTTHAVGELLDGIEPLLRRVGPRTATVAFSIAPAPLFVRVDRPALEQAIVNLIKNAGDAMPDGGTVTVSATAAELDAAALRRGAPAPGSYVAVRVADHGHGIKPELLERVFEPFFTTKAFGSNTGLGLTMVYAFAKNSGGYVEVASTVGRGTTVSLFLPRVPARTSSLAPEPRSRPPASGRGELILVVDDEPLVARSTSKILERNGYRVIVAGGGQEAIEAVRDRAAEVRLAVIDVVMPDMSGPEVSRHLAELGVVGRRLFVSGYAAGEVETDTGPGELLQKPFTPEELVARVRGLIDDEGGAGSASRSGDEERRLL